MHTEAPHTLTCVHARFCISSGSKNNWENRVFTENRARITFPSGWMFWGKGNISKRNSPSLSFKFYLNPLHSDWNTEKISLRYQKAGSDKKASVSVLPTSYLSSSFSPNFLHTPALFSFKFIFFFFFKEEAYTGWG